MHPDQVLAFLDQHPDFLQSHAQRFGLDNGRQSAGVVSLTERRLLALQDKNNQLSTQLHQLTQHAHDNDLLQQRLQKLCLALLSTSTLSELITEIDSCFKRDFALEQVALRLWHPQSEPFTEVYATATIKSYTQSLKAPSCGRCANDAIIACFSSTLVLQSFCQIPLRFNEGEAFGLLVLASINAERFTFDMDTVYLARMGELISQALQRAFNKTL